MIRSLATVLLVSVAAPAVADELGGPPPRPSAIEPSEAARLAFRAPGAAAGFAPTAEVRPDATDDAGWSLFNPRPRDQLRPLSIDESPITLDAGHVQGEFDVAVVGLERAGGGRSIQTSVMTSRLKVGVSDRVEAQLVIAPFAHVRTEVGGAMTRTSGYGGTTGRLKVNLWGNDGGRTALAVVPYARGDADGLSLGVGVPIAVDLGRGFGLTVVPQLEQTPASTGGSTTVTVGHAIVGPLSAQLETCALADVRAPGAVGVQASSGLSVLLGEHAELDAGTRLGVVGDLPDVEVFVRLSARR